jgi:choline dehydrogenase
MKLAITGCVAFASEVYCSLCKLEERPRESAMAAADQLDYDYVVIGAGAAGSIVAGEAAARGYRVLLLEAGAEVGSDQNDVWDPTRWNEVLASKSPNYEIGFTSTSQPNLDNRVINLLQSKGLGGCQIHNAMVYVRGGRSTYDHWASDLGCTGWSYDELLPFFEQVERTVDISSPPPSAFGDALVAAFGRLGLPLNPTYNSGPTEYGAVPFQFTVAAQGPRRSTSYEAFISARTLPTLTVQTGCFVRRLIVGEGTPVVEYKNGLGEIVTVQPGREVIVSAGAIATPALLLRSGIGPAQALQKLGIASRYDLPAVGQNFYDDLGVGVVVAPSTVAMDAQSYGYIGVGAFATASGTAPGPVPGYGEVNIEIQISTSSLPGSPDFGPLFSNGYALIGSSSLHLKSRGTVTLASADPDAPPVVDPGWLSDPGDWPRVLASLGLVYRLASDTGLAAAGGWMPLPVQPVNPIFPEFPIKVAEAWIRLSGLTVQHYVGSCAMGSDATTSVVDPASLRVHGVPGLRVIDASVAPTPVTGNTAGVSMVIGAKGAALLLGGDRT